MSRKLFSLNPDLKRLRDEGFFVQQVGGYLVMRGVPYVTPQREVKFGTLISTLLLAGDTTQQPNPHTIYFDGDYPCAANGQPLNQIRNQSCIFDLGHGLKARHTFSSKPLCGFYADYYEKMATYAGILAGAAEVVQPGITAKTFKVPDDEDDSVFNYIDTASDRAGIGALADLLKQEAIGIVGLGGSGGYILDFVAKTPVREIRLFDKDEFLTHNAFRAPGAPSIDELRDAPRKVDHFAAIYGRMHRGIVPHAVAIDAANLHLLDGLTFVFVSIDDGEAKRDIVATLESMGIAFIDVGMGLELVDGSLGGILRVTASTPACRAHVHAGRIPFAGGAANDIYASNIQVADLNALNATLAVIKWKKLRGFYRDFERELHMTYTSDGNMIVNGDQE